MTLKIKKGINYIYEMLLQDKITDHYLHKYHVKGTPFIILHDINFQNMEE